MIIVVVVVSIVLCVRVALLVFHRYKMVGGRTTRLPQTTWPRNKMVTHHLGWADRGFCQAGDLPRWVATNKQWLPRCPSCISSSSSSAELRRNRCFLKFFFWTMPRLEKGWILIHRRRFRAQEEERKNRTEGKNFSDKIREKVSSSNYYPKESDQKCRCPWRNISSILSFFIHPCHQRVSESIERLTQLLNYVKFSRLPAVTENRTRMF